MFIKNSLTTFANKFKLSLIVASAKPARLADAMTPTSHDVGGNPFILADKGVFFASPKSNQNSYERPTKSRQQKTASEKAAQKNQKKLFYTQIIKQFLENVKSKFVLPNFKPKRRDFTIQDLELIQKLWIKNEKDYPKSWDEFYKITGTNKNTFNN